MRTAGRGPGPIASTAPTASTAPAALTTLTLTLTLTLSGLPACQDPAEDPARDPAQEEASTGDAPAPEPAPEPDDPPPEIEPGCGNGVLEGDEQCDLGFANADAGACTSACTLPRCGDGRVGPDETCDEGPDNGGPACSEQCTVPTRLRWSTTRGSAAHGWDLALVIAPAPDGSTFTLRQMEEQAGSWTTVVDRFAPDGTEQWSTTLPESTVYTGLTASLVPSPTGGLLLGIFGEDPGVEGSERIELLHLDDDGNHERLYVVPSTPAAQVINGKITRAGDRIVLATIVEVGPDDYQTRVERLTPDGEVEQLSQIEPNLSRIVGTESGSIYAYGDASLMAFDAHDMLKWSVPASGVSAVALAVDDQGPLLARRESSGERLLRAFDADGRLRWQTALQLVPRALAVGPGIVAVVGDADADPTELPTNLELGVEVLDAEGRSRWVERVGGPGYGEDQGRGVAVTPDGAIWVCGDVAVPFEEHDAWLGRFEEALR